MVNWSKVSDVVGKFVIASRHQTSSCERQSSEPRGSCLGTWGTLKPSCQPLQVDGHCCEDVLQMCLGHSSVPTVAQATDLRALGDRAFHSSALGIGFLEFIRCLTLTSLLQCKVSLFGMEPDRAGRLGMANALGARGAGTADGRGPLSYDEGFPLWVLNRIPTQVGFSLRAGDLLLLPVNDKAGETISPFPMRLP